MSLDELREHLNINAITNQTYSYERIKEISDWLLEKVTLRPKVGIVCGNGFGDLAELMTETTVFPLRDIPHFPEKPVTYNKGNLVFGLLNKIPVVCMQGRYHTFEGYSSAFCSMSMKLFKLIGIKTVILTCRASSLGDTFNVGDIGIFKDHISPLCWTLQNPLVGHNDDRFGPRFPATNMAYSRELRKLLEKVAQDKNIEVKQGIFSLLGGPNHQTVTEMRGLMVLGTEAIVASTVNEAIVASYCGMKVVAIGLIENKMNIEYDSESLHEENPELVDKRSQEAISLIADFVQEYYKSTLDSNNNSYLDTSSNV